MSAWFWSLLGYTEDASVVVPGETTLENTSMIVPAETTPVNTSVVPSETDTKDESDYVNIIDSNANTKDTSRNIPTEPVCNNVENKSLDKILETDIHVRVPEPSPWSDYIVFYKTHPCSVAIKSYWAERDTRSKTLTTSLDFHKTFNQLKRFISLKERLPSIRSHNKTEKYLSRWLSRQNKKTLSEEERRLLDSIPQWNDRNEFIENCNMISSFSSNNKRLPVPFSFNKTEKYLGNWLHRQLKLYHEDKLATFEIDSLKRIPFFDWSL